MMTDPTALYDGPSAAEFETCARDALTRMPDEFREKMTRIVLSITEFATAEQLEAVEISNRWELSGLYEGTPLTEQSVWEPTRMPPVISLFRQPLLREMAETGVGFAELVRHVVIHEAGHHFGLSDEDMHALEDMVGD
ncbi:metallopeptidase family protein [uncultured Erythrobacter sp.]|uniref:metallopeptidase family protein n=1 Tax=uncultured Erythrobacter sp. TaxID=263913 RepID=UPI002607E4FF|nr:metallopeptidase family protein [uncultured Erythrobacter sp.]